MKNRLWAKLAVIVLLCTIIVTAGTGTGCVYYYQQGKQEAIVGDGGKQKDPDNAESKSNQPSDDAENKGDQSSDDADDKDDQSSDGAEDKGDQSSDNTTDKDQPADDAGNENDQPSENQTEEMIAEYSTQSSSDSNRDRNLALACKSLNDKVIEPGKTFSFNDVVGETTEEDGYVEGPVIVDGTSVEQDIGGGVCQVCTTLYNAALIADMGIVERTRHSFPSEYVPVGLDAMISYPTSDLKIENRSKTPIRIHASAEAGKVMIQLYGGEMNKDVRISAEVLKETDPPDPEVRVTTKLKPGKQQVIQEARKGYKTRVYREYYENDVCTSRELISEDTYPEIQQIVLEGSSKVNK